jgi:TrmH family RNA methyltransferase
MLTKNKIKFARSLRSKKERYAHNYFIIEGEKIVDEAINSLFEMHSIIGLKNFKDRYSGIDFHIASSQEMKTISSLKNSPGVLAIVKCKDWSNLSLAKGKYLLLDRLNDPGNLGSIIRISDWFGLDGIICSHSSVDVYNQKVVQASMGSLFRTPVWYENLDEIISKSKLPSFAAVMEGEDFSQFAFPNDGLLIMGSESHGVDENLLKIIDHSITIPRIGNAESLNVSVAAGILCQRFTAGN